MNDGWLWWISNYVVSDVCFDLILKSSFATNCPEILRTHPLFLFAITAPVKSAHILNRALILGCNPDTRRFERILRHLLKLFVATVWSGHRRCQINRLSLAYLVIVSDFWEVFISAGKAQMGQHWVYVLAWKRHIFSTFSSMLRASSWIDWHFSFFFRRFQMFLWIVCSADVSNWFPQLAPYLIIWTVFIASKVLMGLSATKGLNFVLERNLKHILICF